MNRRRRCAITGLAAPKLLRASKAKPWADSSDAVRLEVHNGLLLAAHWDTAFDTGRVTFTPNGSVLYGPALPVEAAGLLACWPAGTAGRPARPSGGGA